MLPVVELALNKAVYDSTSYTLYYVNGPTHPLIHFTLPLRGPGLGGGDTVDGLSIISSVTLRKHVSDFLAIRIDVIRHVRDAMAESQDKKSTSRCQRQRL